MEETNINNPHYLMIANKLRVARLAVFAALMVLVVCSVAMLRDEITVENLRYLFKYVDVRAPEISGSQKQIYYRANTSSRFAMLRNDLAVLNDSGYEVYSFSGRKIMSANIKYPSPAIETNGKFSLCYDVGGSELSVYNALSCLYEHNFEYGIYGAHLNNGGAFAVITAEKNYTSGIEVYSKRYSKVFRWMSPDKHVMSVFLADNDKTVACASVISQNGKFITEFFTFDLSDGSQKINCAFEDEFPYKVSYQNGVYLLITDKAVHFINNKGQQKAEFSYPRNSLESFHIGEKSIALSCKNSVLGNENIIKVVDFNGNLMYNKSYAEQVLSLDFDQTYFYVLRKGKLDIINYDIVDKKIFPSAQTDISIGADIQYVFCAENGNYVLVSPEGAVKYSAQSFISKMPQKS